MSEAKFAFGIDLGTTNSCIAVIGGENQPEVITLNNGDKTMPSCVMYTENGGVVVGKAAYENRHLDCTVYSVKRLMGTDRYVNVKIGKKNKSFKPEQVSSEILKELVAQVPERYGAVKDVVVTVPAYFDNRQVQATKDAVSLAGLNLLGISREPTAAALAYAFLSNLNKERKVLVYDLGGGTFDVSLVRMQPKSTDVDFSAAEELYGEEFRSDDEDEDAAGLIVTVLKNDGDNFLGGDDIDLNLARDLLRAAGVDPTVEYNRNREQFEKLLLTLEHVKKLDYPDTILPYKAYNGKNEPVDVSLYGTPQVYYNSVRPVYLKTAEKLKRVFRGQDLASLDSIILVGGSTKSDTLKNLMKDEYPNITINDSLNPDESVALGAAVQANYIQNGGIKLNLTEILPIAIGVKADGKMRKMIESNTPVPYSCTKQFLTEEDNQEFINIEVYQGESNDITECVYIGSLYFPSIPQRACGEVKILVSLEIDHEGFLYCNATVEGESIKTRLQNIFQQNSGPEISTDRKARKWTAIAEKEKDKELKKMVCLYTEGKLAASEIEGYLRTKIEKSKREKANKVLPISK